MRILVMQTTRMGDVLQTTPLVRALRCKYPDAHIAYMVRNMGKAIAQRNPDVNEVLVHEEDEMYLDMRSDDSDRFLRAYRTAEAQIARLRDGRYDIAFNCTHSIASSMLLKLAGIPKVVGAHLSDDWQYVLRGRWINYFYTSVFHREYNDLNLCDISQRFLEDVDPQRRLVFETNEEDEAFADDLLRRHGIAPSDFIVCLQLGASEDSKRWAEIRFAELARLLAGKYKAKILLVGVREEAHLGQVFEQHAPGIATHLYGETTIPQLAAILKRARLLITNDTGTMHIAAAMDCKVLLVSVGFVHFRETGPYGEGHCAIEWRRAHIGRADNVPVGMDERALIQPEQVMRAVEYLLENDGDGPIRQMDESPEMVPVDLYTTRFASDGCLAWYPVLRRPITDRDLLRIAYRAMWLQHLSGLAQTSPSDLPSPATRHLLYYNPPDPDLVNVRGPELASRFEKLATLARRGIEWTEELLVCLKQTRGVKHARQIAAELARLDEEIRVFSEVHPCCKPLALIARYERDNLEGSDPLNLAETTLGIYKDCETRALLMREKLLALLKAIGHCQSGPENSNEANTP